MCEIKPASFDSKNNTETAAGFHYEFTQYIKF